MRTLRLLYLAVVATVCGTLVSAAQDLPDEIRGYKVHDARITVTNKGGTTGNDDRSEAYVRLDDPVLVDKSLTGITFEIGGEIETLGQSGRVDFLMFRDFTVNGLGVGIEEYRESFEFKKKSVLRLPRPVRVELGTVQALRGAIGELRDSKEFWDVSGTVLVFGRFKKWGMKFKRVVPVRVDVRIRNPIRDSGLIRGGILFGAPLPPIRGSGLE